MADAIGADGMSGATGRAPMAGRGAGGGPGRHGTMPVRACRWLRAPSVPGVAAVRVVTALTLLVSVGCSAPAPRPFTPSDLPAGDPGASGQAVVAPTGPAGPRTETVRVAPGVRVVVEWPVTADQDITGMIEALRDYRAGSFKSVLTGGQDTAYLQVVQDDASSDAYRWVREFLDQHRSVRGTSRLYALNVSSVTGRGAVLHACVDETRMRLLDSGTGKAVRPQPAWTRKPFFQLVGLRRGDDGVWRIKLLQHAELPSEPAKGCVR
ncbi:hypothetical protein FHR32_004099 [Streptosporangium album]|uniref:Uncharacterized protein n=1 Tax=Streptosporangium album TaxID=47479 RepID=A0A7W7WB40_9ACTN|nr:hypothetical protein [Streptosporangium album]MBB4939794.1 hypothetical protein [Streptosporangium album]